MLARIAHILASIDGRERAVDFIDSVLEEDRHRAVRRKESGQEPVRSANERLVYHEA